MMSSVRVWFGLWLLSLGVMQVSAVATTISVPGTSDIWLAGMPNGATASNGDTVPYQSPVQVSGVPIVDGVSLLFTATGQVRQSPYQSYAGPDGNGGWIASHDAGAQNGISSVQNVPINALIGVFLNDSQPSYSSAPSALDFSSNLNLPYLSPVLKQVFFIGNGFTSTDEQQRFVVPSGATRLFLATMDSSQNGNNQGYFTVTATAVPEPGTFVLLSCGLLALFAYWRTKSQR